MEFLRQAADGIFRIYQWTWNCWDIFLASVYPLVKVICQRLLLPSLSNFLS